MKAATGSQLKKKQVHDLLTAVFTLCSLDSSLTDPAMDGIITRSRAEAAKRISKLSPNRKVVVDLDVLGHVIYIWQRTATYLGNDGQPIAIPARGPAPSIQALFSVVKRDMYFEQGFKHLLRLKRIRRVRTKRYVPCSEVTIIEGLTPEMVLQLVQTMNRMVATVLHNTSQRNTSALKLIERVTAVPDLPIKNIRAFKKFAREQGGTLIDTMNEWLESRRGSRKARAAKTSKHLTAGLHVFSFIEKNGR
jgi:hypothetical protein